MTESRTPAETKLAPSAQTRVLPRPKLRHLENLCQFLSCVFQGEPGLPGSFQLSMEEKRILNCFTLKKYKHAAEQLKGRFGVPMEISSPSKIAELGEFLKILPSSRRKEENFKLVLNWALGFLRQRAQEELAETDADAAFFRKYFCEIARELNMEASAFGRPNFSRCDSRQLKTFNSTFLANLRLSKPFMEDLKTALRVHFEPSIRLVINRKVNRQCKKWDRELGKEQPTRPKLDRLCGSMISNRRTKMPWTIAECLNAAEVVIDSLFPSNQSRI